MYMRQSLKEYINRFRQITDYNYILTETTTAKGKGVSKLTLDDSSKTKFVNSTNDLTSNISKKLQEINATKFEEIKGNVTKRDIDDMLENKGRLVEFFTDAHDFTLFFIRFTDEGADLAINWLKSIENKDLDLLSDEEIRELIQVIMSKKGWSNKSPELKKFWDELPNLKKWLLEASTKSQTYFKDLFDSWSEENLFRDWVKRKYNNDPKTKELDYSIGSNYELTKELKNKYGKDWNYETAKSDRANAKGPWSPSWGTLPVPGVQITKGKGWRFRAKYKTYYYEFRPLRVTGIEQLGQLWSSGVGGKVAVISGALTTATGYVLGIIYNWGSVMTEQTYETALKTFDATMRNFKESAQDGVLVRQILDGSITKESLDISYNGFVNWENLQILDESLADEYARKLLINGEQFMRPAGKAITESDGTQYAKDFEWNNLVEDYINTVLYSIPDGLGLIYVVERFKKLKENPSGLGPLEYWGKVLQDWWKIPSLDFSIKGETLSYAKMTNARSGQSMILSLMIPATLLKLETNYAGEKLEGLIDKIKKNPKLAPKTSSGADTTADGAPVTYVERPLIDLNVIELNIRQRKKEIFENANRFKVVTNGNNFIIKPSRDSERYVGAALCDSEHYQGEGCNKANKVLRRLYTEYLRESVDKAITSDPYDLDKIVSYYNNNWPIITKEKVVNGQKQTETIDLRGRIDIRNKDLEKEYKTPDYGIPEPDQKVNTGGGTGGNTGGGGTGGNTGGGGKGGNTGGGGKGGNTGSNDVELNENTKRFGLAKLLSEQTTGTQPANYRWQAALFQDWMDDKRPNGWWSGGTYTSSTTIDRDYNKSYGVFDTITTKEYKNRTEEKGDYPKDSVPQIESALFKIYSPKFRFKLQGATNYQVIDSNPEYARNVYDMIRVSPTLPFEVLFYCGIMNVIGNSVSSIQVSEPTKTVLEKYKENIKQLLSSE